jgi:hypothetical protein
MSDDRKRDKPQQIPGNKERGQAWDHKINGSNSDLNKGNLGNEVTSWNKPPRPPKEND